MSEFVPVNNEFRNSHLINKDGVVKTINGRVLKTRILSGYKTVELTYGGYRKAFGIHRLLGLTFLDCKDDEVVMHIDNNKLNLSLDNLKCGLQQDNCAQASDDNLLPQSKPVVKMDLNNREIETFNSMSKAAMSLGNINKNIMIKRACENNTAYNGYNWKFNG